MAACSPPCSKGESRKYSSPRSRDFQTPAPHIPTFIVIGGPEIHAGYIRRLLKAEEAGKISFGRIVVIDRDPACPARRLASTRVLIETTTWNDWLSGNLSQCGTADHLVPYHWAPHVLLDWLASDLAGRGFTLTRDSDAGSPPAHPPFLRPTAGGDLALSHATWLCPPACIEPALCPHTRGPKTWSLATELAQAPESYVFPCLHLAYGVGTIPLAAIFDVRDRILARLGQGATAARAWVGSASHCHGLAARVRF